MPNLLEKAKMPVGKDVKRRLDNWLNENINIPLSSRGHPDVGAALAAAISAGGELVIPDDLADAAMALVPGARLLKAGKKGMKALKLGDQAVNVTRSGKKLKAGLEKPGVINFGSIKEAEDTARKAKITKADNAADTLVYDSKGNITRKKAPVDKWSDKLEMLEKEVTKKGK